MKSTPTPEETFKENIESLKNNATFRTEQALLDITFGISDIMQSQGMTYTDLAKRIPDLEPEDVKRFLSGHEAMTIEEAACIGLALGYSLKCTYEKIQ